MPGYSYYEQATGQPIAAPVAEYLATAPTEGIAQPILVRAGASGDH
jgi:hypothetical protein